MNTADRLARSAGSGGRAEPAGPRQTEPAGRGVALRAVPRAAPRLRWRRLAGLLGVVVAVALLFGVVVAHVVLTQDKFRLERLESLAAAEQERYEELRAEVARLEAPERVVTAAQERLGMVPAEEVTYLAPSAGPPPGAPLAEPPEAAGPTSWPTLKPHLDSRP